MNFDPCDDQNSSPIIEPLLSPESRVHDLQCPIENWFCADVTTSLVLIHRPFAKLLSQQIGWYQSLL